MIRNEKEYQEAVKRLEQDQQVIAKQKERFKELNLTPQQMEKAIEPVLSFHEQLADEVEWYERVKRGDFEVISKLSQIGRSLIALRIASGLSQKDLADRLGVAETQISRDERNEYHGISVDRAQKIMDLFHAKMRGKLEIDDTYRRPMAKAS